MYKVAKILVVSLFLFAAPNAQSENKIGLVSIESIYNQMIESRKSTQLFQVTFPADSDTFNIEYVRFGAWVRDTTAIVKVAGEKLAVFTTGAFAGRFQLSYGWNTIPFEIQSESGSAEKDFHLFRKLKEDDYPAKPTKINPETLSPRSSNYYYNEDEITVGFKGSPGGQASFIIKKIMKKPLPMIETRLGYYKGIYQIQSGDQCKNQPVRFTLIGKNGRKDKSKSKGKITISNSGQPIRLATTENVTLIRYAPNSEIFLLLPPGIQLEGISKTGAWWHVRISENRTGYVLNNSVKKLDTGLALSRAYLNSISAEKDSSWLIYRFNMSNHVPFRLVQHIDPQMISVYFYRTHFQDEWTKYPYPDDFVKRIFWEQEENDVLRFDIYLNTKQQWGFRGEFTAGAFLLSIRIPPIIKKNNVFANIKIALDAGHGGRYKGALGATGISEKEVNLVYTMYVADLLEKRGADIFLTRDKDTTLNLGDRMDLAREQNAHMLLWLHNNSTGWARDPFEIEGTSTFYTHLQAWPFSVAVYPHLLELGLAPEGRVHRTYYITRQTDMVVYLVEGAFISNPKDEMWLINDVNLKKLAEAVVNGLEDRLIQIAEE